MSFQRAFEVDVVRLYPLFHQQGMPMDGCGILDMGLDRAGHAMPSHAMS